MIHLDANTYLLRAGDPPTCGYLIERGSVDVLLERADGEHVLAVLGPGEIVGEMALVDHAPRTASVRTREECLLLPITADHMAKRLAAADPVLRLVLGTILDRFRATLDSVAGKAVSRIAPLAPEKRLVVAAATAELRLQKELQGAFDDGQILVHYQPIVRLSDGCLTGFEALARWAHPVRGLVPPSVFVPLAEVSGLSGRLARTCLAHVARDLSRLKAVALRRPAHIEGPRVAVNISGYDLKTYDLVQELGDVIAAGGHSADCITLELTETALVHSPSDAAAKLEDARRLGFKIAVDDFGTGYSSLNYIRTLPVDTLKIDKAFVQSMLDCATTRSIVMSMLRLAASLGVHVVGEGVETAEQRSLLDELGCGFGQGYLFGRPLPLDQTLALMKTWRCDGASLPVTCAPAA